MPRAAARMACAAALLTACCTQSLPNADSIPIAAHAQPAARLLDKLRTLMLQRRGKVRLGCRLRLGARLSACLAHLGKLLYLIKSWHIMSRRRDRLQLVSVTTCATSLRAWGHQSCCLSVTGEITCGGKLVQCIGLGKSRVG